MTEPLSEQEIEEIRDIIEKDKRWKWLATTMRNVAVWIAAVLGTAILFGDTFVKFLKGIAK